MGMSLGMQFTLVFVCGLCVGAVLAIGAAIWYGAKDK